MARLFAFNAEAAENPGTMPARLMPARREAEVTAERALTLSTLYRGIQIHATSVSQLSIDVERNGVVLPETPALALKPDVDETRSAFLEYTVNSLYLDGNAFWRVTRGPLGEVINLSVLNPAEVTVEVVYDAAGLATKRYWWRGKPLGARDVRHLQLLRIPGVARGLGPIQAAQIEVRGALDARDYGALWLSDANLPDGILSTDQELAPGDADKYRNVWYGRNPDGTERDDAAERNITERLRVLGKGLNYTPLLLKPSDIQFLETQQYTTIQMARLIGAPASIMLVAVEGNSQTYANVEQEWIGYVRFGLMKPLREIEDALSELLPGRQRAKFNVDALLRTDTKTRYEAHGLSLDPQRGWATVDEVRAIEQMAPLTDAQRAELEARRPTKTTNTEQEAPTNA
ncbi:MULTISPECIES: phage portal protein [unclassified Leifsonia]|uniref:phage portal protein n=1 Tax=unclassified Leifsonia TaxID=2663824 RepID=UPI0012FDD1F2|nr:MULTISPECIES: phage portal protein [unclassified Leifsonia]